jgi:Na+/phosphate symporter
MLIAIYPFIAILLGALIYALSSNAKLAEMGRLTFGSGMLVLIFVLASKVLRLG